jgi:hypothetical protein
MTAFYPLVLSGSQIEELQAGDTINATVTTATNATNLIGGAAGSVPYQTGATNTTFLSIGGAGTVITSTGSAPQWSAQSTLAVGSATNLAGGTAGALAYNTGAGATTFLTLGTSTHILTAGASAPQYTDPTTITVGTATNATNTAITEDTATNAEMYLTWVTANTGNLPQKVTSTKLTFNPSSGVLTCTGGVSGGTF